MAAQAVGGNWTSEPTPVSSCDIAASGEGILDMARGDFQQHAWGCLAFKRLLRWSDDRSLPLVEKICNSMGFWAANRLRVEKIGTAGSFSSLLPLIRIIKRVTGVKKLTAKKNR